MSNAAHEHVEADEVGEGYPPPYRDMLSPEAVAKRRAALQERLSKYPPKPKLTPERIRELRAQAPWTEEEFEAWYQAMQEIIAEKRGTAV